MDAVVTTLQGKLRGSAGDGVYAFLGVPYAAPPFGVNRLRPPRPAGLWDGARDATRYGAAPPQVAPPAAAADSAWDTGVTGEDCLTLNSGRLIRVRAGCRSWCGFRVASSSSGGRRGMTAGT